MKLTIKTTNEYDVMIGSGLLDQTGELVREVCPDVSIALVTDSNVSKLYGGKVADSLRDAGMEVSSFVFEAGEAGKTGKTLLQILEFMAEAGLSRKDVVIALGGGVKGDLAGLAAAMYMRGIRYVQIPTSILAAVDSSVGGKTAIDLPQGKNLAGAFHQPSLVIIDTVVFGTLPQRVFNSGFGEVIKYAMISDPGILGMIEGCKGNGAGGTQQAGETWGGTHLEAVIEKCVAIKAEIVGRDEFDDGPRHLLNFGHTVGHAIEKASGFAISHGEAVASGMMMITEAAVRAGRCERSAAEDLRSALDLFDLPLTCEYDRNTLIEYIAIDKKMSKGNIDVIIPEKTGKCVIEKMTMEELRRFL